MEEGSAPSLSGIDGSAPNSSNNLIHGKLLECAAKYIDENEEKESNEQ